MLKNKILRCEAMQSLAGLGKAWHGGDWLGADRQCMEPGFIPAIYLK